MKVKCLDNNGCDEFLTKNNIYEVLPTAGSLMVYIQNCDNHKSGYFASRRFEEIIKYLLMEIPNGSILEYKKHKYFVSDGLQKRIVTREDGTWFFLDKLNWKAFRIIYLNG